MVSGSSSARVKRFSTLESSSIRIVHDDIAWYERKSVIGRYLGAGSFLCRWKILADLYGCKSNRRTVQRYDQLSDDGRRYPRTMVGSDPCQWCGIWRIVVPWWWRTQIPCSADMGSSRIPPCFWRYYSDRIWHRDNEIKTWDSTYDLRRNGR